MTGHGAKYGRKTEEAIAALLTHKNIDEAAKAVGISNKTLFRWMQLPEFDKAYRAARRAAFGQATARLQQASSAAVSALLKVLVDAATPASARVRAADVILDHAQEAIELEDIEARVRELEEAAKKNGIQQK
jgi:transposase-like protein